MVEFIFERWRVTDNTLLKLESDGDLTSRTLVYMLTAWRCEASSVGRTRLTTGWTLHVFEGFVGVCSVFFLSWKDIRCLVRCFHRGRLASRLTDEALTRVGGFGLKKRSFSRFIYCRVSGRNCKKKKVYLKKTLKIPQRELVPLFGPQRFAAQTINNTVSTQDRGNSWAARGQTTWLQYITMVTQMTVSCGWAKARDLCPTHTHTGTHISASPLNRYLTTHIQTSLSAGCQSFISATAGPVGDATLALIRIGSCQHESGAVVQ